jgi:hypothetical protein
MIRLYRFSIDRYDYEKYEGSQSAPGSKREMILSLMPTYNVDSGKVEHVLLRLDDLPFPLVLRGQRSRKLIVQNVVVRAARGETLYVERVGCGSKVSASTGGKTVQPGLLVLAVIVAGSERGSRGEERKDGDQNSGGQHVCEVLELVVVCVDDY